MFLCEMLGLDLNSIGLSSTSPMSLWKSNTIGIQFAMCAKPMLHFYYNHQDNPVTSQIRYTSPSLHKKAQLPYTGPSLQKKMNVNATAEARHQDNLQAGKFAATITRVILCKKTPRLFQIGTRKLHIACKNLVTHRLLDFIPFSIK